MSKLDGLNRLNTTEIVYDVISLACLTFSTVTHWQFRNIPYAQWPMQMPEWLSLSIAVIGNQAANLVLIGPAVRIDNIKEVLDQESEQRDQGNDDLLREKLLDHSEQDVGEEKLEASPRKRRFFSLSNQWFFMTFIIGFNCSQLSMMYIPQRHFRPGPPAERDCSAMVPQAKVYDTKYPLEGYWKKDSLQELVLPSGNSTWTQIRKGLPKREMYTCPTFMCSWDAFSTLGMCTQCESVSTQTSTSCTTSDQSITCQYTTPSGLELFAAYQRSHIGHPGVNTLLNSTSRWQADGLFTNSTIATAATLRLPKSGGEYNRMSLALPQAEVTECRFSWCLRTYQGVSSKGGNFTTGNSTPINLDLVERSSYLVFKNAEPKKKSICLGNDTFYVRTQAAYDMGVSLAGLFDVALQSNTTFSQDPDDDSFAAALYHSSDVGELVSRVSDTVTDQMRMRENRKDFLGRPHWHQEYRLFSWIHFGLPWVQLVLGWFYLKRKTQRLISSSKL